MTHKSKITPLG